jgi:hypothetical protein
MTHLTNHVSDANSEEQTLSGIGASSGRAKSAAPENHNVYLQAAPQNREGRFTKLLKPLGFVCLLLIGLVVAKGILTHEDVNRKNDSSITASSAEPATESESTSRRFHVGDQVKAGGWTYQVRYVSWTPYVRDGESNLEMADAAFMVIDLVVDNNNPTPSFLPSNELIDSQDREYEPSSRALFVPGAFEVLKPLKPNVSSEGKLVFDVPPDRKYTLWLSGGTTSGTGVLIDLPVHQMPPSAQAPSTNLGPQEQPAASH